MVAARHESLARRLGSTGSRACTLFSRHRVLATIAAAAVLVGCSDPRAAYFASAEAHLKAKDAALDAWGNAVREAIEVDTDVVAAASAHARAVAASAAYADAATARSAKFHAATREAEAARSLAEAGAAVRYNDDGASRAAAERAGVAFAAAGAEAEAEAQAELWTQGNFDRAVGAYSEAEAEARAAAFRRISTLYADCYEAGVEAREAWSAAQGAATHGEVGSGWFADADARAAKAWDIAQRAFGTTSTDPPLARKYAAALEAARIAWEAAQRAKASHD